MEDYSVDAGENNKYQTGQAKTKKDPPQKYSKIPPDPPKKALCPFFLYRMDIYDEIKK